MDDSQAYKGYYIRRNPFTGAYAVSKGGFHISWAPSLAAAKAIIDLLT